jgi:hypothetical protein
VFKSTHQDSRTGPEGPVLHGPSGPIFYTALIAVVLGFGVYFDRTVATSAAGAGTPTVQADLARARASDNVRHVAQWAIDSGDHGGLPFVVVDKELARLFAFDAAGRLKASTPVLLGAVRGDAPEVPATPAGRFVIDTWQSSVKGAVVMVNGDVALSLHALPSPVSPGRGMERLASDRVEDKRISDGSLHVASDFYQQFIEPLRGQTGVAYVLPEVLPLHGVFNPAARDDALRMAQWPRQQLSRRPS